ncbi:tRNA pseudouridine(55) synthase TruB [Oscillatoria salina]|uniref:tRNA pseudouridine(55) synthase TruB n=1 Tax=Oscillatoria salina TaxID=331517 RepID=UPI0013BC7D48|nr:tRNA pseudouridine(55) synthase TruB [Oscillatoria salina]MBZ8179615.1 tRNA pseudouridine(55) synthase TruB [Oscillatoria salina IIICB1]NET90135.1 tRNA pseudouridine(55) synthase TruB [Kamptonema sp. SIO1D9]
MLGFLNLNKPAGLTSHDCVAKVRKMLKIKRVGHGGTLDPAATGVLPIAIGKATRLLQFLPTAKAYHARIRFGVKMTTDDLEGEIIATKSTADLSLEKIEPHLSNFLGKIEQIPPAYSAIQREGKRMYELARAGEKVEVPSRIVEVTKLEILAWYPGEFPELEVAINCGGGTYIRAIARDLGEAVGTGGTLVNLMRTESCGLNLADSLTFEELSDRLTEGTFELTSPEQVLSHLPRVTLASSEAKRWCQGQKINLSQEKKSSLFVQVYGEESFLGIGEIVASEKEQLLLPKVVLAS